jgi:thioredoxin-related protein
MQPAKYRSCRRRFTAALLAGVSGTGLSTLANSASPARHDRLIVASRLDMLDAAVQSDRILLLLFSRPACGFCEALRRDQLLGIARSRPKSRVNVLELDMTQTQRFRDISSGAALTRWHESPAQLAQSLGVRVAPTLLFLSRTGESAERLIGYGSPDFYGAYLDQRIEASLAHAQGGKS